MNLFFYKQDKKTPSEFETFIEAFQAKKVMKNKEKENAIEALVNSAHLDTNGSLRCCISLG